MPKNTRQKRRTASGVSKITPTESEVGNKTESLTSNDRNCEHQTKKAFGIEAGKGFKETQHARARRKEPALFQ